MENRRQKCHAGSSPVLSANIFGVSKMNKLTLLQIKQRIVLFNQTHDFSVFDDIPWEQLHLILYPEIFDLEKYILAAFDFVVYECDKNDETKFLSKILYQSDLIEDVEKFAEKQFVKNKKAYVIYQPKTKQIHGGFGWDANEE